MRSLILISTLLFGFSGQTDKLDIATNFECEKIQKHFNQKLKEITWDKDGSDELVTDSFYNTYLKDIKEFNMRDEHVDLYYHSLPDIRTGDCLVIIKSVYKYDLYAYSYRLVNLGQKPKVILELAALEDYPDGQKRVNSIFLNDNYLRKTKVTEYLGDYNQKTDSYQIIADSVTLTYRLQSNKFTLEKTDSIFDYNTSINNYFVGIWTGFKVRLNSVTGKSRQICK